MSPLHSCSQCSSLNPQGQVICINCDATLVYPVTKSSNLVGKVLKGAGVLALSMTLSACYGGGEGEYLCIDSDMDGVCEDLDCDDEDSDVTYECTGSAGETMNAMDDEMNAMDDEMNAMDDEMSAMDGESDESDPTP